MGYKLWIWVTDHERKLDWAIIVCLGIMVCMAIARPWVSDPEQAASCCPCPTVTPTATTAPTTTPTVTAEPTATPTEPPATSMPSTPVPPIPTAVGVQLPSCDGEIVWAWGGEWVYGRLQDGTPVALARTSFDDGEPSKYLVCNHTMMEEGGWGHEHCFTVYPENMTLYEWDWCGTPTPTPWWEEEYHQGG